MLKVESAPPLLSRLLKKGVRLIFRRNGWLIPGMLGSQKNRQPPFFSSLLVRLAILAVLAIATGCRSTPGPTPNIDPAMASRVPPSATLLAGIDLVRLRASPFYAKLPPAVLTLLDPLREASFLMLASDGHNLLSIARGPFGQAPAGATLVSKDVAISGTPDFMSAAQTAHLASSLVAYAGTIASGVQVWIVAQGGVTLPLTGNAANLNRLLRDCENSAITVKLGSTMELSFTALGRTSDAAQKVEDTLRATITLTIAGESRSTDMVALLRSIQLTRDDRTVRATVSATPDAAQKLLGGLAP
jgi:hypothetical protein